MADIEKVKKELENMASELSVVSFCHVYRGKEYAEKTMEALSVINEQQAKSVDSFVQWCIDSHMMGDATLNCIKYWVEKYKEFVSKGR